MPKSNKTPSKISRRNKTELENVPRDIKSNILSRLPVKILCKFKCVSKEWYAIISDPVFKEMHRQQLKRKPQLLLLDHLYGSDAEEVDIEVVNNEEAGGLNHEDTQEVDDEEDIKEVIHVSFVDLDRGISRHEVLGLAYCSLDILPSGHGLVCLASDECFNICNPATQEFVTLPEPSRSLSAYLEAGFGYLPFTNEYKVVHMFGRSIVDSICDTGCEIFTLSDGVKATSGSWRVIESSCPYPISSSGVLVNNSFYWMIGEECDIPVGELILSLDLEEEKFDTICLPQVSSFEEGNDLYLVELEGYLCLADTFAIPSVTNIWMLSDHKDKVWVKQYTINLLTLDGFDDEMTEITVMGCQEGEIIVDSGEEWLTYYNPESNRFRRGINLKLLEDTRLCLYTESFFSLGTR